MNMKKSVLALAVTGAIVAPATASAAEVYGRVDIGIESEIQGESEGGTEGTPNWVFTGFNGNQNAGATLENALQMQNGNQSRVGFTGSEDIGGGWSVSTKIELEADVLQDAGLGTGTRLGWIQFANDQHSITVGKQWQPAYEYMGWNQGRLPTHGYYNYFQTFSLMGDAGTVGGRSSGATGYRQDTSIGYTFGGGGYSNDPFTFDVLLGINNGDPTDANGDGNLDDGVDTPANEATISSIQVFAASTFGPGITINGGVVQDFTDYGNNPANVREREPFLASVGGRFPIGDLIEIGASFYQVDPDTNADNDDYTSGAVTGFWSFGGGWSAQTGFQIVDADDNAPVTATDVNQVNLAVTNQITSRTSIRLISELVPTEENANGNALAGDGGGVVMLGLQHDF